MLRRHRQHQLASRTAGMWRSYAAGANPVITNPDGSVPSPDVVSQHFIKLIKRRGLREIRLHDLRHHWASEALRNGVNVKVISEALGHSDPAITLRVYSP